MIKIKQHFDDTSIKDVRCAVWNQCQASWVDIKPDSRIAIAVGSRAISNLTCIVKTVAEWVVSKGAKPFIVPAMGSHGGATNEGQLQVLRNLGISEASVCAPVYSDMDAVQLDAGVLKHKIYMDRYAAGAHGIILINRIKPHTSFHADHESGLVKLCVIGLGKQKQAEEIHRYGLYGLKNLLLPTFHQIRKQVNILFGVGIVENAYLLIVVVLSRFALRVTGAVMEFVNKLLT
jgi:hypothetical protein